MFDCFAFYGLKPHYHLDKAALRQLYLQKARDNHPDLHRLAGPEDQVEYEVQAAANSVAYGVLADDNMRLKHIFQLEGLLTADGESARKLPPDFLMEMMEMNEAVEAGADVGDEISALMDARNQAIEAAMTEYDAGRGGLEQALEAWLERKYLLRLTEIPPKFAPPLN